MKHCNPTNCAKTCNKFVADKKEPEFCKHWDIAGDWQNDRYTGVNGVCTLGKKRDIVTLDNRKKNTKFCSCGASLESYHGSREFCDVCKLDRDRFYRQRIKEKQNAINEA